MPSASLSSSLSRNFFFSDNALPFELYIPSVARKLPLFRPLQTRAEHNKESAVCAKSAVDARERTWRKKRQGEKKPRWEKLKKTTRRALTRDRICRYLFFFTSFRLSFYWISQFQALWFHRCLELFPGDFLSVSVYIAVLFFTRCFVLYMRSSILLHKDTNFDSRCGSNQIW